MTNKVGERDGVAFIHFMMTHKAVKNKLGLNWRWTTVDNNTKFFFQTWKYLDFFL